MSDSGGPPIDPHGHPGRRGAATLDEAALAKLHELDPDGRRGVVKRVLAAFESSLVRWIAQLEGGPGAVDAAVLGHIAHTLKSSAGSVGAKDLAAASARLEGRLRSGETVDLSEETQRLVMLADDALAAIRAMLRD